MWPPAASPLRPTVQGRSWQLRHPDGNNSSDGIRWSRCWDRRISNGCVKRFVAAPHACGNLIDLDTRILQLRCRALSDCSALWTGVFQAAEARHAQGKARARAAVLHLRRTQKAPGGERSRDPGHGLPRCEFWVWPEGLLQISRRKTLSGSFAREFWKTNEARRGLCAWGSPGRRHARRSANTCVLLNCALSCSSSPRWGNEWVRDVVELNEDGGVKDVYHKDAVLWEWEKNAEG